MDYIDYYYFDILTRESITIIANDLFITISFLRRHKLINHIM